jgi:hypothetical protein
MSFDYSEIAELSAELLSEFGRTITQKRISNGAYNPATSSVVQVTTTRRRYGALFEFSQQSLSGGQYIRGSMVESGDKQLLLDTTYDVELSDIFTIGTQEYTVVSIAETNPAGMPVLYELHVRKS